MTIHNFSTYNLTEYDIQLLNRGLTFSPSPDKYDQHQVLKDFNSFARSLRLNYSRAKHTKKIYPSPNTSATTTAMLYRPMKFMPPITPDTAVTRYSGFASLKKYIDDTKQSIADKLPSICIIKNPNLSSTQKHSLKKLQKAAKELTIKPADNNLGIVLLDTDDYVVQCSKHLADRDTYIPAKLSTTRIKNQLTCLLASYTTQLTAHSKRLYKYLNSTSITQIPRFYGLPKIHKPFTRLPPLRPIISQSASLLSPSAKFIDHVLQPIACAYPDYLRNSTSLVHTLQDLHVPDEAILVTVDVCNLFPSIPQTECLNIIYNELHNHKHLLLFNPDLIIRLLHLNITNNFFTFEKCVFQQIQGTAMGAPFSPTMANIYMSIFLKNFLQTQPSKPYLLKRYIDDILIIWTGTLVQLQQFIQDLNKFNPNLKFTHQQSASTIDFLDVTIYKDTSFPFTNILDVKTFQKKLNLYQYLHFSSEHPRSVFKAFIKGECIRYIKTNYTEESYIATVFSFRKCLLRRDYPAIFVEKATDTVKYSDRQNYLNKISKPPGPPPPLYKLVSPSGFNSLKQLVLQNYSKLKSMFPRFIPLRHPTLHNKLVRAQIKLTDSQFVDLTLSLNLEEEVPPSESLVKLPNLRPLKHSINACKQPRCLTCKVHLNTTPTFKSNYPLNQTQYAIRHTFSCRSSNVVYLV